MASAMATGIGNCVETAGCGGFMAAVAEIMALCGRSGWTFGTAESCTGGMIGGAVTAAPGVSEFYKGGIVSYSNEIKERILGVDGAVLATAGAVSRECAGQMAQGARRVLGVDFSVAVTGIAGPGGATPGKPVGLVYIATASPGGVEVTRNLFGGGRESVRAATVRAALAQLLESMRSWRG